MSSSMKKWQHLKIPFTDIKEATKDFNKCIGYGGYGKVYQGELIIDGKYSNLVAVKRLNEQFGQGLKEFLTEIELLSGQEHENLISLIGYCDEGKEKIIVYEYAARGSLDRYIRTKPLASSPNNNTSNNYTPLTWLQRLKICVGAAHGLDHLHNHFGEHQTIIHRDIKSANILLDENWVAKISDLGLSKLSLAGLDRSAVVSHACGTPGYCEPEYIYTGVVKKESDVYSFGMVLFEVMCGRLCTIKDEDGFLLSASEAKDSYEKDKLDKIIDLSLRKQMSPASMEKYSTIAYRCLHDERKHRPSMDTVVIELKESLKLQEEYEVEKEEKLRSPGIVVEFDSDEYWKMKLPKDIEDIIKRFNKPPVYNTRKQLFSLLRKGYYFDHGLRFFSLNEDGIKCETIFSKAFLKWKPRGMIKPGGRGNGELGGRSRSRGSEGRDDEGRYPHIEELNARCHIRTSMLSLGVTYAANLLCSFGHWDVPGSLDDSPNWVWIKWQCQDLCVSSAHLVEEIRSGKKNYRLSGWKTTLWHFVNNDKDAYFDIVINRILGSKEGGIPYVMIHGIEFQPLYVKDDDQQSESQEPEGVSLSDEYQGIIDRSDTHLECTTIKELYILLCGGILIDNGRKWFSLSKSTGGKCHMLPAIEMLAFPMWKPRMPRGSPSGLLSDTREPNRVDRLFLSESRFKEVVRLQKGREYYFKCQLELDMLSSSTTYGCYLVFKFLDGYNNTQKDACLLRASYISAGRLSSEAYAHLKLHEPINTPIIKPTNKNKLHDSWNAPKVKGSVLPKKYIDGRLNYFMEQRNDGWMEVRILRPLNNYDQTHLIEVNLLCMEGDFNGFVVEGIEFKPI